MTYEITFGMVITLIAGEAVGQYRGVLLQSDGKVDLADSAGGDMDGVAQMAATADGEAIPVMVSGPVSKMLVGTGGITVGQKCQLVSDGITLAASGDHVVGKALETGSAGELVAVLLTSQHILA